MKLAMTEVYEVATFYHHFDVVKESDARRRALTVRVCETLSCQMAGADTLRRELATLEARGVRVLPAPCIGRCEQAPAAVVGRNAIGHATADKIVAAVDGNARGASRRAYIDYAQYRAGGGYALLAECIAGTRSPDAVIAEMESSALRGLGGAGFPAGRKWKIVRAEPAPRLMAVNIDEGEPGTFKDRYYLERDPHRFLEGMLIAAWAVGIDDIYIYLRDEYAGAARSSSASSRRCGRSAVPAAGDPPAPRRRRVHLRRRVGDDRVDRRQARHAAPAPAVRRAGRPVRPARRSSTTWRRCSGCATSSPRAPTWFAGQGRNGRKGLRSFSVSGRVKNPGVHLAPAGITVRELIAEYCGGMLDGHDFYGYLPGGASGGILPASMGDIPLDFDTLQPHGCFIGSAAVIVLSHRDRARDAAQNMMEFFAEESCGQCTPCRVGTDKAAVLMREKRWNKPLLADLSQAMMDASICGLGQAAPNPIACVVKYFPQEIDS